MISSNQAVPSRTGATWGRITAVSRASGNRLRTALMAGVAITVSPIKLGQKTTIFMKDRTGFRVTPLTAEGRHHSNPDVLAELSSAGDQRLEKVLECLETVHDLQFDAQGAKGKMTQLRGAKLDQIFLGGQGEIRPAVARPLAELADVRCRVGMMVRKPLQVDEPSAQRQQGAAESLGIADAAKGHDLLAGQFRERVGLSVAVDQVAGGVPRFDERPRRSPPLDLLRGSPLAGRESSRSARERITAEAR